MSANRRLAPDLTGDYGVMDPADGYWHLSGVTFERASECELFPALLRFAQEWHAAMNTTALDVDETGVSREAWAAMMDAVRTHHERLAERFDGAACGFPPNRRVASR